MNPQQPPGGFGPPGYPPQGPGSPLQQGAPQQPGSPQPSYPQPQQGYAAPQQPGYAPQPQGYPPQQPGYPQQAGYPQQPGYPQNPYPQPGYPAPQPPPAKAPRPVAVIIGVIIALALVAVVGVVLIVAASRTPEARLGGSPGVGGLIGNAVRSPQTIFDEQVAVSAHGWQTRMFTLPQPRIIQLTATGVSNTDKGFMLYMMPTSECESFKPGQSIHQVPGFEGMKVRQFANTGPVAQGSWCIMIDNSENILNGMVVALKVVSDPSQ